MSAGHGEELMASRTAGPVRPICASIASGGDETPASAVQGEAVSEHTALASQVSCGMGSPWSALRGSGMEGSYRPPGTAPRRALRMVATQRPPSARVERSTAWGNASEAQRRP